MASIVSWSVGAEETATASVATTAAAARRHRFFVLLIVSALPPSLNRHIHSLLGRLEASASALVEEQGRRRLWSSVECVEVALAGCRSSALLSIFFVQGTRMSVERSNPKCPGECCRPRWPLSAYLSLTLARTSHCDQAPSARRRETVFVHSHSIIGGSCSQWRRPAGGTTLSLRRRRRRQAPVPPTDSKKKALAKSLRRRRHSFCNYCCLSLPAYISFFTPTINKLVIRKTYRGLALLTIIGITSDDRRSI